jgi:3-deoxy-D-manno-octulosonate 8-phosphate phosphatase (KDO 8-P phosphatase)
VDRVVTGDLDRGEQTRRASRIRLVLTDCDGVLTDAGVYYSERGEELKRFSIRDGMGFERLRRAGIAVAIVTGETSGSVVRRAEKLGAMGFFGVVDKAARLPAVLDETGASLGEVAYIGDDINDLGVIAAVGGAGLVGAPADAMPEVRRVAHYVTEARGGRGAFREFAEWILRLARGE